MLLITFIIGLSHARVIVQDDFAFIISNTKDLIIKEQNHSMSSGKRAKTTANVITEKVNDLIGWWRLSKDRKWRKVNKYTLLVYYFISLIYMELVLKITFEGFNFGSIYMLLFSVPTALFLFLISSLFKRKINKRIAIIAMSLVTLLFLVQTVYHTIFRMYLTLLTALRGARALQFGSIILGGIKESWFTLLLLTIPLLILIFIGCKKWFPRRTNMTFAIIIGSTMVVTHILCLVLLLISGKTFGSAYDLYNVSKNTERSIEKLGLMTSARIDLKRTVFGFKDPAELLAEKKAAMPTGTPKPTPIVTYPANVLDIDFAALKAKTEDEDIQSMHDYFSQEEPTYQNEKTGIYKDHNLIMIIAESFSPYAISQEYTPTLYKMVQEGYNFTNYYNAYWDGSTIAGEFGADFGLLPIWDDGYGSIMKIMNNDSYFTMGWQLQRQGYPTYAFHSNTYTYYDRDKIYPTMGYEYYGKGNGLELKNAEYWPKSDVETIEASLPYYLGTDKQQPFHSYYMSISGHCNYNFAENMMSHVHEQDVENLQLSEEGKAYVACNMELDLSLKLLLEKLEEAGVAENTLIMITPDHYPYEMSEDAYDELAGHKLERDLELYKSTLILYNPGMKPETVDTPCSAVDILPTLSNLMGLPYDSRLMSGRDIFSDSEHIVFLRGRSWVTDKAHYNTKTEVATPQNGAQVDEAYIERINGIVAERFAASSKIIENDYYRIVFGGNDST